MVVSEHLLEEVRDVLLRQKMRRYFPSSEVPVYLDRLRATVMVAEGAPSGAGSTSDRNDDYLVGLVGFIAISRDAEYRLVSGDRHLLDLPDLAVKDAEGGTLARVLTPREFLEELERAG